MHEREVDDACSFFSLLCALVHLSHPIIIVKQYKKYDTFIFSVFEEFNVFG